MSPQRNENQWFFLSSDIDVFLTVGEVPLNMYNVTLQPHTHFEGGDPAELHWRNIDLSVSFINSENMDTIIAITHCLNSQRATAITDWKDVINCANCAVINWPGTLWSSFCSFLLRNPLNIVDDIQCRRYAATLDWGKSFREWLLNVWMATHEVRCHSRSDRSAPISPRTLRNCNRK